MSTNVIPARLLIDKSSGKIKGLTDSGISYATPFPVPNGTPGGGDSNMLGVIMHTEVGYDPNVVREFESPDSHASAFFSISMTGHITQYGPVGRNWMAWAQVAGNPMYYSIEHEDKGNPNIPLSTAQVRACAQVVEMLSRFAGFPLTLANEPGEKGFGVHYMGGAAWGGHTCPDLVPGKGPRSLQRSDILSLAHNIRIHGELVRHVGDGHQTWNQLAAARGTTVQHLLSQALASFTTEDLDEVGKLAIEQGWPYYLVP